MTHEDDAATEDGYDGPTVGGLPYPAGRLIEQPDPRPPLAAEHHDSRTFGDRPEVDAQAQALVWSLTASEHATEALTALAALEDIRAGQQADPDEVGSLIRKAEYHKQAHAIADKCAGTWALVASVQPVDEQADLDAAFQAGLTYTDETPQDGKSGHDAER